MTTNFQKIKNVDLPVFRSNFPAESRIYTPGYAIRVTHREADYIESELGLQKTATNDEIANLRLCARRALDDRNRIFTHLYTPVCLTLYLNNSCNLACGYCYSQPTKGRGQRLRLEEIIAGARLVAQNCHEQGKPLTVVFHGGGEPTLDKPLIDAALVQIEKIAKRYRLDVFRYIATNGVMSSAQSQWLSKQFDLVGISCDGPGFIQNNQRPLRIANKISGDHLSSHYIEHTASILRQHNKRFHVRVTVTPASVTFQPEIARYICETLQPHEIHVEPVYIGGRTMSTDSFALEMEEGFVSEFLLARKLAASYGIPWSISGTRINEIHGPYCHIYRDVLNLIPGGWITACFKISKMESPLENPLIIGWIDKDTGLACIIKEKVIKLQQQFTQIPNQCEECFNQYHCTYLCPDDCVFNHPKTDSQPGHVNKFRCKVSSLLAQEFIREKEIDRRSLLL